MRPTLVALQSARPVARVVLESGAVVPRLIARGPASAQIALVAGQALLLGGDHVRIAVRVGEGCRLELRDIGGTVAYDADDELCRWEVDVELAAEASLSWRGLPLVVAGGARVHRVTRIRLGPDARALIRETVVLGRAGELGGRVVARTTVTSGTGPVLDDLIEATGAEPIPGILGSLRVVDTLTLVGVRPPIRAGDLVLEEAGAVRRYLGNDAHRSDLDGVWCVWKDLAETR